MNKNSPDWMIDGPGYTTYICKNYMEKCLIYLLEIQELTDIISCVILMHMKNNPSEHDDGSSGGGYSIPLNSTTEALVSLSVTIDLVGCWVQGLEQNLLELCNMYFGTMKFVSENTS